LQSTTLTSAPYLQLRDSKAKFPIPELHNNKHHDKEVNLFSAYFFVSETCHAKPTNTQAKLKITAPRSYSTKTAMTPQQKSRIRHNNRSELVYHYVMYKNRE